MPIEIDLSSKLIPVPLIVSPIESCCDWLHQLLSLLRDHPRAQDLQILLLQPSWTRPEMPFTGDWLLIISFLVNPLEIDWILQSIRELIRAVAAHK